MVDPDLTGRRVIVSGSTRGLGRAFVEALCRHGASVVLNGRDEAACAALVQEIRSAGGTAVGVAGSVADTDVITRLVDAAVAAYGGIDLVVNNAGLTRDRSLLRMTPAEFDEVVAVHLRGTWDLTRQSAAVMRAAGGGAVLNLVSGSALYGLVGQANYAAAKGGVLALTRALSVELAPYGVRVNALYPVAATEMTAPVLALAGEEGGLPVFEAPDRVSPVVVHLASAAADGVAGQVLCFDGRELSTWTHPRRAATVARPGAWSAADVASALLDLPPEPLHPDPLGVAVLDGLRRATTTRSPS